MGWILLLLTLFTYCSGSFSQFTLTQPPLQSASSGHTAQLSCTISGLTFGFFEWYQQKEGNSPKFLLSYKVSSGETEFGSEVSGHFSASTDDPRKVAYLTIANVVTTDEATYYCGAAHSSGSSYMYIFGGGTELFITGGPQSPPTVNLYCPSKEEMASKRTATIPCMVNDYNPSPATAIWEVGGTAVSNGVQTTKPVKDNGKYMFSSYLTVTDSEWERDIPHTCKVRHEGQDYMKSVSQSQCP